MNRKWQAIILTTVALLAMGMTGCAETPTAESLATRAMSEIENTKSYSLNMNFTFSGDTSVSGITAYYKLGGDCDIEESVEEQNTEKAHITGDYYLNVSDTSHNSSVDSYIDTDEDGKNSTIYTSYNHKDWEQSEYERKDDYDHLTWGDYLFYEGISNGDIEAELSEETKQVNGEDCYVLTFSPDSETMKKLLSDYIISSKEAGIFLRESSDWDWDPFSADVKLYINKETGRTARMELSSKDLGSIIMEDSYAPAIVAVMSAVPGIENGFEINVNDFEMIIDITDYDKAEIEIPDEVKDAEKADSTEDGESAIEEALENSEDTGGTGEDSQDTVTTEEDAQDAGSTGEDAKVDSETDNEEDTDDYTYKEIHSGTMDITDGVNTATVSIPEGFTALGQTVELNDQVSAYNDSYTTYAYITFNDYFDTDGYLQSAVDTGYMNDEDYTNIKVGDSKTENVSGYDVSYITMEYMFDGNDWYYNYYCCAEVNGELLVAEINFINFEGKKPEADDSVVENVYNAITMH